MRYLILLSLLFIGCCPKYRTVYCDSMASVVRLTNNCQVIKIRVRDKRPQYIVKARCIPPEERKDDK